MMESLANIYNNREQVVVVVIQPMRKFYIDYLISTTNYRPNT